MYEDCDDFENIEDFLSKAKSSNGSSGFVSVSFTGCSSPLDILYPVEKAEEISAFSEIKLENSVFQLKTTPKSSPEKYSNSSIFRFGLAPLEAIEESQVEDPIHSKITKLFQSQITSPRINQIPLEIPQNLKRFHSKTDRKPAKLNPIQTSKKLLNSPYAKLFHFSPQRLPSIRVSEKTAKFLKRHNALQKS